MTIEVEDITHETFGWFYYKRGRYFGVIKNHYLPPERQQTLCGNHTVAPSDMVHVRFTDANHLFKHKICKTCSSLLGARSLANLV